MTLHQLQRLMKSGVQGLWLFFCCCFAASWAHSAAGRDTAPIVAAMAGVDVQSLYDSHVADTVSSICITCHRNGGVAAFAQPPAQLLFTGDTVVDRQRLDYFVAKKGSELVLNKVQGINHGGGAVLDTNTTEFSLLAEYLESAEPATPEKTFERLLDSVQRFRGRP